MEALLKPQVEISQKNTVVPEKGERRRAGRRRFAPSNLPVRIGRRDGILVDLSTRGARVRHSGSLELGGSIPLSFVHEDEHFVATARVLASRVVGLGTGAIGTSYESRITFGDLPEEMLDLVKRLLETAR